MAVPTSPPRTTGSLREITQSTDQVTFLIVQQQTELGFIAVDFELSSFTFDGAQPSVTILHVIHRIVGRLRSPQFQINVHRGINAGAHERVTCPVRTNGFDQILQGNHGSSTFRHAHRFAIAQQVNHLTNQYFDVVWLITQRLCRSTQTSDVTMVVGT